MRVLFVMDNPAFLRYFDSAVLTMLERGHHVKLAFNTPGWLADGLEAIRDADPGPEVLGQAPARDDAYADVANRIRAAIDFARYLDPLYADAAYLRNRRRLTVVKLGALPPALVALRTLKPRWVRLLLRGLLALEAAVPPSRSVGDFIAAQRPDAVLVTPLVAPDASPQTDYVKSARALGIPVALCVASWDNLTNKGLIRVMPDRVTVWNETQRDEAIALHRVPPERVSVTGAQTYDRWFDRAPRMDADAFRALVGLPAGRRFLLYVGSTSNIARRGVEERFVRDWLAAIRSSDDPELRDIPILVRPHPERPGEWYDGNIAGDGVVIWPPERAADVTNVTAESRAIYFDSLFHSAAVVGINTSAMVESAIINRPVLSVEDERFRQAHEGTLHFGYLLPENGGFLRLAPDLPSHVRDVAAALRSPSDAHRLNRAFVERFIRPHGIAAPATPRLLDDVEAFAAAGPAGERPARVQPLRLVVRLAAAQLRRREDPGRRDAAVARMTYLRNALGAGAGRTRSAAPLSAALDWGAERAAARRRTVARRPKERRLRRRAAERRSRELLDRTAA